MSQVEKDNVCAKCAEHLVGQCVVCGGPVWAAADKRIEDNARAAHELEVWRQAYNAALNGVYYIVGAKTCCTFAAEVADCALADYRAMRAELLGEE